MTISKILSNIKFIDYCIRTESSYKVEDIAKELGISERQVFNYLKIMKNEGFPIAYNRKTHKFYYTEPGYLYFGFLKEEKVKSE